jgi:hypothetical protein
MTEETTASALSGDRPVITAELDLLGFGPLAAQLAKALCNESLRDGMVIGIEGDWGSGKSTLVNLMVEAMETQIVVSPPIHIAFSPWLIGHRDDLLRGFFDALQSGIRNSKIEAGDKGALLQKSKDAVLEMLRKFGGAIEFTGELAKKSGWIGNPVAEPMGNGLNWFSRKLKETKIRDLTQLKASLENALKGFDRRIIVTIDDLDRLEPSEIAEVFRLVKSVGDLPNIVYVLCYDRAIVSEAIQKANSIENGEAFLEKIIQISLKVPMPEPFVLRGIFEKKLGEVIRFSTLTDDQKLRLGEVINDHGGDRLKTPRDIARVMDRIRFAWPAIKTHVDAADFVWLELIRATNPKLYDWVERYVPLMCMLALGAKSLNDATKNGMTSELNELLENEKSQGNELNWTLKSHLGGVDFFKFLSEQTLPIFKTEKFNTADLIANRRLSSPDHYRYYFALAQPEGAAGEIDLRVLVDALEASQHKLHWQLEAWAMQPVPGGTKLGQMLERLSFRKNEALSDAQSAALFEALARVKIEAPLNSFGDPLYWGSARDFVQSLKFADATIIEPAILSGFEKGNALDWLVELLRSDTFRQGVYGDRASPPHEHLFNEGLFQSILELMRERFAGLSMQTILEIDQPLQLLFAWAQITDGAAVRAFVSAYIDTKDENLCNFLEKIRSKIPDHAERLVLPRKQDIGYFLDIEAEIERLTSLSEGQTEVASRASSILAALNARGSA